MDLLEYQAKALFREMDIPVLPSQRIDHAQDLKGLKIPYPVVLKSQVRAGGRGKAGGIRFVENTIDAVAATQAIFNLPIMGEYPQVLLAEAKYDADQEFYLAVILDPVARRPLLLGSQQGGVNVEATLCHIQEVIVDQDFSPFYARRLAVKMGLKRELILSVSTIIEKMYRLFVEKDLDLVEINPLGISRTGEVMALDGKVIANNGALGRHPDLMAFLDCDLSANYQDSSSERRQFHHQLNLVEQSGNIGILCNGAGLTMATVDLVIQKKGKPASFLNLGSENHYTMTDGLRERLSQGLDLILLSKQAQVVLVNFLCHEKAGSLLLTELTNYLKRRSRIYQLPTFVLRLACSPQDIDQEQLADLSLFFFNDLDEAVNQAVSLAEGKS